MFKNRKWNWGIILLFLCGVLITLMMHNGKYNRYISEDMEQSINRLNESFNNNRSHLHNILHSDEEPKVNDEQLSKLTIFHRDIERELFNLKKKSPLLKKDLGKRIQIIWAEFNHNDEMNTHKAQEYYRALSEKLSANGNAILDKNDKSELELIFLFYNNTKEDLNKLSEVQGLGIEIVTP